MSSKDEWMDRIAEWFEKGEEGSPDLIDLPWEVAKEKNGPFNKVSASHPKIPFEINTLVMDNQIKIGIFTGIETDFLEIGERLKIYKALLTINSESFLVKIGITGLESVIVVGADLYIPELDRNEFNKALSSLVMTTYAVYKYLGKEEELNQAATQKIFQIAIDSITSGMNESEVVGYLMTKIGLDKVTAEEIVKSIIGMRKAQQESTRNEDLVYFG